MKKVLLSLLTLLICIGASAKDVYKFTLGEELTLDQVKEGTTPFVLVRASDTKLIVYGTNGNQYAMKNLAEVAETDLAYYFKMVPIKGNATYEEKLGEARELAENAFNGDESNDALYMIRPYKRDNNPFSVWGNSNMYVAHCGWTTNANSIDPDALKFGDDAKYGCIWKVIASANGYTIQNQSIDNKNYLTGNGGPGASTDWKFYSVAQVLVANTSWKFTKISFEDALTSEDPVVMVQNDLVLTNSNGGVNYSTKNDFDSFAYWVKFEAYNAGENQYYITLNKENGEKVNYFNASYYSHVYLSGVDKEGTRGEKQNSAIFTIAEMGENQYSIRNLGSVEGCYGEDQQEKGYVNFTTAPTAYWKNNATWQNASPIAWEFYTVTDRQVVPLAPYTISTTAGKIGTIALDYPATITGATLYKVVGFSATVGLDLAEVEGDMVGGTPYIYVATADEVVCTKTGASVAHGDYDCTKGEVGNGLVGCYSEVSPSTGWFGFIRENGYVISNGKLRNIANGNVTIPANRCFFDSSKCTENNAVGSIKMRIAPAEEDATAIKNVNAALEGGKIYDMNGREVKAMQKGNIYVVGGMKVFVK